MASKKIFTMESFFVICLITFAYLLSWALTGEFSWYVAGLVGLFTIIVLIVDYIVDTQGLYSFEGLLVFHIITFIYFVVWLITQELKWFFIAAIELFLSLFLVRDYWQDNGKASLDAFLTAKIFRKWFAK